jgi:4-hydroxybenzoate polyprenyltransferase
MDYSSLSAYLLSIVTAAAFALMGYRLGRGTVMWCIAGAILGLCISTICIGLMHAATLPYTPSKFRMREWVGIIVAVVLIGITGALIGVANRNGINRA